MTQPLGGVTVADFTTAHQGPWATQKLGDLGANVVKIERIGGEWSRQLTAGGELYYGESPFWLSANRSKRSIQIDLKHDEGRAVALDIVRESDVLVENFRPGVMDRFGLAYETVTEVAPDIIYVSASGFGSDGPYAERPGQDLLMQSLSGMAQSVGRADDPPTPIPFPVVDGHSAMQVALYTMVALFHRERTGEGQRVEVNLLDSAIDSQCQGFTVECNVDREFERSDEGIGQKYLGAPYGIYETRDGHVAIAMTPMERLADVLDLEALASYDSPEAAFETRDEIKRTLESHTRTLTTDDLLETLVEADVWAARLNDFEAAAEDPQVRHNEIIIEVEHPTEGTFTTTGTPATLSKTPAAVQNRPPNAGEHTAELLAEFGYDNEEIATLVDAGAIE
jgi:crotonobetainyl-CoA:carnitine CoA-transferase CaiB-like acyl-CoA transferase